MKTREVKVKNIGIGGDNPVRVQSMTSTPTIDIARTVEQILKLHKAGAELIRIAIPDYKSLRAFRVIREELPDIPLIADIHFNYKLAIGAIEAGADKIRINPGNIGERKKVREIIHAAKSHGVPIRIGVNSGSLEMELIDKYKGVKPEALVESALKWVEFFVQQDFDDIIISVKSSDVKYTIRAYELLASETDFPLHVGLTEAGPKFTGTIKSSIAIGYLLYRGIGDTIRVSLTADPVEEVKVAWEILKVLGLRNRGPILISCPTCARTRINLFKLVQEVEKLLENYRDLSLKVAVMGCEVNGPGEARDADIGVAAEPGRGVIFKKGKVLKRVSEEEIITVLKEELDKIRREVQKC